MDFVRAGAVEAELPNARIDALDLILEEAIVNVCHYAYPKGEPGIMKVAYSIPAPGELSVEIADQGHEFNPLSAETPDVTLSLENRRVGGLGILLVKRLATSLTWRREDGWNRLTVGISAAA
jgi:anti-sigma regulatory factor (Ser/Thr protein kinase)